MKFSSTTNTKSKSAQTTYVKIDISFFYCPLFSKDFFNPQDQQNGKHIFD